MLAITHFHRKRFTFTLKMISFKHPFINLNEHKVCFANNEHQISDFRFPQKSFLNCFLLKNGQDTEKRVKSEI